MARLVPWLAAASLVLAGLVADAPALDHPFVNWDDPAYVTANPYIRSLSPAAVVRLFAPSTIVVANYAPVTLLSLAVDYARGGLDAGVYHQTNVVLHLASALLVLLLLRRLSGRLDLAWVGAVVYLLHPVQVESVAWVAERKNVLSQVLALGAMLVELGLHDDRASPAAAPRRSPLRRPIALVLFALALLAKATVVVVPLLLVAVWRLADGVAWRDIGRRVAPYAALALVMGGVTLLAQRGAGGIKPYYGDSALLTLATMTRVVWLELRLFVDPGQLSAIHRPPIASSPLEPSVVMATLALVAVAAAAWALRRRWPLVTLCVAWYAIGLLPVLNIVPLPHLMAERFLYLSSIGIAGLVGLAVCALADLARGSRGGQRPGDGQRPGGGQRPGDAPAARPDNARTVRAAAPLAVTLALGCLLGGVCLAATRARLPVWGDSERLWRDTLARTPTAEVAHANLGLVLAARGDTTAAMAHYRRALELRPDYLEARINLANALTRGGDLEAALAEYRLALDIEPANAEVLYNLGVTLDRAGADGAARDAYRAAIEASPDQGQALNNLALHEARAGHPEQALALLDRAVRATPANAEAHLNRGILLGRLGRYEEALVELRRATELRPDYARAHLQLGLGLLGSGRAAEGRRAVARALELDPQLAAGLPPEIRALLDRR